MFDLQICRNFKGEMFGQLSNDNAIRANMQGCDAILSAGDHDLYCTAKTGDNCYVFGLPLLPNPIVAVVHQNNPD